MKLSKELNDALEAVSKEVDSWPTWKRSIDLHDLKKVSEPAQNNESQQESAGNGRKTTHFARAARA
jgi:hypothetical protein